MNPSPAAVAMLDLPPVAGRSALRAGLRVLGVHPGGLPIDRRGRDTVLRKLGEHPNTVVFIDIARAGASTSPTLHELDALLPHDASRQRVSHAHGEQSRQRRRPALGAISGLRRPAARVRRAGLRRQSAQRARHRGARVVVATLGLLVHVSHDHPFLDDHLFYRLAVSDAADRVELGAVFNTLRGANGVQINDRSHLGKTYAACWIGAEAVACLCAPYGLARHEAWLALHRLMQFGLIEHAAHARPFVDGAFFYRFAGLPADEQE